jgi:mannose-1-phosphate guanylyltransferase/mannose-6-phosphate isomerase
MKIFPVILCGGVGTRLWPLSREHFPKQFLPLLDDSETLLQATVKRLQRLDATPIVICNREHRFIVAEQLRKMGLTSFKIILEPIGRNTAPAAAIAALLIEQMDPEAIMAIIPADHYIADSEYFTDRLRLAAEYAQDNLITFGIKATKPETGYGYIEAGAEIAPDQVYHVNQFVEKPNLENAKKYIERGNFYWNSGIFVFKAKKYLHELETYAPDILEANRQAFFTSQQDLDFLCIAKEAFEKCRTDSIDYAVMERAKNVVVIPFNSAWNDLGSWTTLWENITKDENGNVKRGDVITKDVKNSYLRADNRLLAVVGMENCIVVETSDSVMVANKDHAQSIKNIVALLKDNDREEAINHCKVYRPWGSYEVLIESSAFKVKHIVVKPGASLSLQLHHKRAEHWVVVSGVAEVTRGEETLTLKQDQSLYIPANTKHRLNNYGETSLEIIEVQTGAYLGEDDIVRFEDRYGRVEN